MTGLLNLLLKLIEVIVGLFVTKDKDLRRQLDEMYETKEAVRRQREQLIEARRIRDKQLEKMAPIDVLRSLSQGGPQ